jgi:hypothetical protein
VRRLYALLFQRTPDQEELNAGLLYLRKPMSAESKLSRLATYAQSLMMTNEFLFVD